MHRGLRHKRNTTFNRWERCVTIVYSQEGSRIIAPPPPPQYAHMRHSTKKRNKQHKTTKQTQQTTKQTAQNNKTNALRSKISQPILRAWLYNIFSRWSARSQGFGYLEWEARCGGHERVECSRTSPKRNNCWQLEQSQYVLSSSSSGHVSVLVLVLGLVTPHIRRYLP